MDKHYIKIYKDRIRGAGEVETLEVQSHDNAEIEKIILKDENIAGFVLFSEKDGHANKISLVHVIGEKVDKNYIEKIEGKYSETLFKMKFYGLKNAIVFRNGESEAFDGYVLWDK